MDLNQLLRNYTRRWSWFLGALVTFLLFAYLIVRYSVPEYLIESKIMLLENGGSSPELSLFQDLEVFPGSSFSGNIVEDEIQVIKSRSNVMEVVNNLNLNIRYDLVGNILNSEIYKNHPFKLNFIQSDSIINSSNLNLFIHLKDTTSYMMSFEEDGLKEKYLFGQKAKTPIGDLILTPNNIILKGYVGRDIKVGVRPVADVAENYLQRINIYSIEKGSNVISLSLKDNIREKAMDFIDMLVDVYNDNAIEDKKMIADKTTDFINNRIVDISSNLSSVDQSAEEFKSSRGLTNIASESDVNLNISAATNQELQNTSTQLDIATSMLDYVEGQDGYEVLPSNVGLNDGTIATTTAKYNELVLERRRLLKSSNLNNPIIVNLDQQLDGLRNSLKSSLNSTANNLTLQVNNLSQQRNRINSRIYAAPSNERELRDITRKQQTTESLYLYLLQKREESQIAFASASPKSKIIDRAYEPLNKPVSPDKIKIYLSAIFIGLLIPFLFIYGKELLDNKVHNKSDLENFVGTTPIIAEIPKILKKERKIVKKDDRSVLAESLRILRTNLNYIQKSQKSKPDNLIFITSSVPGEGKTFISSNLAKIYADTGKKVLLVGADIRNPKLYDFFSSDENVEVGKNVQPRRSTKAGLTEFLVNSDLKVQDITVPAHINENEIDLIFSGKIPPNPTELLMNPRMGELFEKVSKMYDYVIVDTAPLMVVTDTLLISEYASQILYVVKAGATELKVIDFPLKLKEEGKLKGLSFVVNNVKQSELGYGGKYGYGYGKSVKKWWSFS